MKKLNKKAKAAVSIFTSVAVVISIMTPVLTLAPQIAYADSEGFNTADDSASVAFTGTDHAWSHPERAEIDNGSYATVTITSSSNISEYLKVYDFDFAIPSNATINGVEVEIERHDACAEQSCTSHIKDYRVRLIKAGTIGSTDYAKTSTNWGSSDSDAVYGGPSDLWGTTWTPSNINHHDTGVVLSVTRTSGGDRTAYVDYIKMKVYYTPAPVDADQDGYTADNDCNDSDATIYPGATEICGNQIDEDCDGSDLTCNYTCEVSQGGVTCDGYFYEDYCEFSPTEGFFANTRFCNEPSGPSCGGLVNINHISCNDQDACTVDGCSVGQCTHSIITCNDDDPCTDDSCDSGAGCVFTPNDQCGPTCTDLDQDTYCAEDNDCNDNDASINPGATEICGNQIDEDCDGSDLECGAEYCGMYFNHTPDGVDFEGPIGGLNPGDNPFNHPTWWEIAKLAFERNDSSLTFGADFLPIPVSLTGDPFHFTAKWQAKLIVSADGNYGYSLRSDDDSWLYVDGTMRADLGGVHAPTTRTGSIHLTQGEHTFNLYFAERHTTQSYLDFHWTTPGVEVIADCEEYCGDGTCNGQEDCESCSQDCGECPPECFQEGESGAVVPGQECCQGLTAINNYGPIESICPEIPPVGGFICTMCGNGICGLGENECNCPQDCSECEINSDCDDQDVCTADICDDGTCVYSTELIINGGFETPEVAHASGWNIFNNSNGLTGWSVEWKSLQDIFREIARPITAFLELQKGAAGDPQEGLQLAELDADWFGPDNSMSGEPASVKIYQDINTESGQTYVISFYFSPRPNTILENNRLEFSWDGGVVDNNIEGAGENNTTWIEKTYILTATGPTTRIEFADLGSPDSLGTYLDNVSVTCSEGPVCDPSPENCTDQIDNDCDQAIDCDDEDCIQDEACIQQPEPFCGDATCNNEETCDSCPQDCGTCGGGGTSGVVTGGGGGGTPIRYCGDTLVHLYLGEECDDGNLIDGDGCSSVCKIEGVVLGASTEQGEVLGATTLPETGQDAVLLIISSIIVAFGAGLGLKKKLSV